MARLAQAWCRRAILPLGKKLQQSVCAQLRGVASVHWNEYISQFRLITLDVDSLAPAIVAIDANGNSVYEQLKARANARMPDILQQLRKARDAAA